tara:strand:+ start:517 stop:783 length:267 start_codon:yes stop_codon:yes gene_type:complete
MVRYRIDNLLDGSFTGYSAYNNKSRFITSMANELLRADYYRVTIKEDGVLLNAFTHYVEATERVYTLTDMDTIECIEKEMDRIHDDLA